MKKILTLLAATTVALTGAAIAAPSPDEAKLKGADRAAAQKQLRDERRVVYHEGLWVAVERSAEFERALGGDTAAIAEILRSRLDCKRVADIRAIGCRVG